MRRKKVHIGVFDSSGDAYISYRKEKEKYVRTMANKYKDVLHPVVYENLMNWTLDAIEYKEV